jgi:hypothetical protein
MSKVERNSPSSHSSRKVSVFSRPVDTLPRPDHFELSQNVAPPSNKAAARPIRADLVMISSKPIWPTEISSRPDAALVRVFSISSRRALFQELRRAR